MTNPLTSNVPVVVTFSLPKLISPDESVINPSAKVMFPTSDPVSAESVPVVVIFSLPKLIDPLESVIDPLANVSAPMVEPVALAIVPVVVTFSSPKLMAPDESVIDPLATVSVPFIAREVPVVVMFSLPKLMAPDESVIEPLASVIVPIPEPVVLPTVPETVTLPVVDSVPSTIKFSLMFTMDESIAVIEVPANPSPSTTNEPDPFALNIRSSLVLVPSMLLSLILIAGNSMPPVPDGFNTMSAFDCVVLISFSTIPNCV